MERYLGWIKNASFASIAAFFWLSLGAAAPAQVPAGGGQSDGSGVSVSDLERIVSTLEDEGKRAELIATLRALIEADRAGAPAETPVTLSGRITATLIASWTKTRHSFAQLIEEARHWPQQFSALRESFVDPVQRARSTDAMMAFVGIFAFGWLAEWVSWKLVAAARRIVEAEVAAGLGERIWRAAAQVLLDLLPVAVFTAAAYFAALIVEPPAAVQAVALNFVNAYAIGRGLMAFARVLVSPAILRSQFISEAAAKKFFTWVRRFVATGVGGYFLIAAVLLLGASRQAAAPLFDVLYFLLAALATVAILAQRHVFARWLRGRAATSGAWRVLAPLLTTLAPTWHILAILYVAGFFAVSTFDIKNGFAYMARGTAGTVSAIAIVAIARALLRDSRRQAKTIAGAPLPPTSLAGRLAAYSPVVRWIAAACLGIAAILLACEGWGIQAFEWVGSVGGQRVISALASIALTLAFAVFAWEAASNAIQRYVTTSASGEPPRMTSARGRTLLPLLQKTLFVFLTVMVVLISLSEIGIDIAPLLAGAGVAGLAIGFGAQRLVQDVITGFFMLVEDAVAVGDVVSVAGVSGVVEDMSVRALKLRDLAGALHTVPFSTVATVTNMTKNFSYYVLDIGVAYHEDPDKVADVCRTILDEMRQEPAFATSILEPLDVFGLDSFGESAIIVKARIKTVPIKQWFVGREFNRRMKQRFETLGIDFPSPHRTIYFGNSRVAASADAGPVSPSKKEAAP